MRNCLPIHCSNETKSRQKIISAFLEYLKSSCILEWQGGKYNVMTAPEKGSVGDGGVKWKTKKKNVN